MFKTLSAAAAILFAGALSLSAATVEFVPPNDPVGRVFTTNTNDGWGSGRGIGFTVNSDQTIGSVGVFQDLRGIDLSFSIHEIDVLDGSFTRGAALRSGGGNETTNGLEWIDYGFADLTLTAGTNYLIEFKFNGNSNQNFFYDNQDLSWNQGAYSFLDGTLGDSFSNTVVAAFRVDGDLNVIPLPAGLPLMLGGLVLLGGMARRRHG